MRIDGENASQKIPTKTIYRLLNNNPYGFISVVTGEEGRKRKAWEPTGTRGSQFMLINPSEDENCWEFIVGVRGQ